MARNWQDVFQRGQGLSPSAISQLSGIEVDLATALAYANGGSLTPLSQKYRLRRFFKKLAAMESAVGQVRWLVTGSSVAPMKFYEFYTDIVRAVGGFSGAIIQAGGSNSGSPRSTRGMSTLTTAGTVTDNTTDFANWWSGITTTFGAAGVRTYGIGGANALYDRAEVIYVGGTGVFSVQVGAAAAVNVDTSLVTAGTLGFYSVSPALATQAFTVSTVSGTPKIVGVGLWNSTVSGLVPMGVAQGGISLDSATANAWTNYTTFLARYLPEVITWEMKTGQWTQTSLTAMLNAIQAGSPNADVVLIGSTPDSTGTNQVTSNALADTVALTYQPTLNVVAWDGYTPLSSYANVVALGWQGDGVHLAWQAEQYLGSLLMRDLGVGVMIGETGGHPIVHADTQFQAGPTPNAPDFTLNGDPSSDLDTYMSFKRYFRLRAIGSSVDFMVIDPSGSGITFLPNLCRVGGSTSPSLNGDSIGQMSVRLGNSSAANADFAARSFISTVVTLTGQSGAVTLDLSLGSIFVVNLVGNVTSLTFSNPGNNGQDVEVHFVQDATGSRTLAGANASIKWQSATAPTLTVTASRRDIFRFRQIGSSYYENAGRSMNVG